MCETCRKNRVGQGNGAPGFFLYDIAGTLNVQHF